MLLRKAFRTLCAAFPVVLILLTVGCNSGVTPPDPEGASRCAGIQETFNFEAFQDFHFGQAPGLGFCPLLETVYDGSIVREENGGYTLKLSFIDMGESVSDDCVEDAIVVDDGCAVIRALPPRSLTAGEVERVRGVFRMVDLCVEEVDPGICVDPCRIIQISWDESAFVGNVFPCGQSTFEFLESAKVEEIMELLAELGGR